MKGLLCKDAGFSCELLVIGCPVCKEEHSIFVKNGRSSIITQGYETICIWGYIEKTENILELNPSFDNTKNEHNPDGCGWHSSKPWNIQVLKLGTYDYRNSFTEAWLKST